MRGRLIAGNVLAVLITSLIAFFGVRTLAADQLSRDVASSVDRGVELFDAMRRAESEQFRSVVASFADSDAIRAVYASGAGSLQASAAFQYAQQTARQVGSQLPAPRARDADVVALTDAEGRVLARNVDPNQERNRDLRSEYEAVERALSGTEVLRDFLKYDSQKWYDVAIAPIRVEGRTVGLLLVGYEIGDSAAAQASQRLGSEVGYVVREGNSFALQSLSFGTQAEKESLLRWINGEANAAQLFQNGQRSIPREVTIGNDSYRVAIKSMPGLIQPTRAGRIRPGFVVLQNYTAARAPAGMIALPVLVLLVLALLAVVLFNLQFANGQLRGIETIEEGLLRIINGDRDHRIELQHPELGGVVYRVNQLVAELTGAEEEGPEGRISRPPPPRPQAPEPAQDATPPLIDESVIGSFNPGGNELDAQLLAQLTAEPEDGYYDRLHREYVIARQRAGQAVDSASKDQFVETVRSSEQMLSQKYSLTSVKFQILVQGGNVLFRAIPIR